MRFLFASAAVLALLATGCDRAGAGKRPAELGSFRVAGVGANADPTVRPARLLPELVDETTTYGSEAGVGTRAIVGGLRVVTSPKGAIVAAGDRLPQAPESTIALPERLGGGFLFRVGASLWRAERWLGPVTPVFTSSQPVRSIVPGLDRVYVRTQSAVLAIDGRTGQVLDLGPWPASPYVASYAAADGWRAAAVTDLRGVVATFDAGATWRPLELPIEPKEVVVSSDNLAIGGFEGSNEAWYELRADGSLARLVAAPRDVSTKLTPTPTPTPRSLRGARVAPSPTASSPTAPSPTAASSQRAHAEPGQDDRDKDDLAAKTFGKRPLASAIEDGWPLTDGTAIVARDGALARVRLADGALVELVRDAFPLESARCHPVTLTRPSAVGAFGFVCGEPRGATVIYAYDPLRGRLMELKRFDTPRVVTSSGNGALAVRGPCAEDGAPPPPARPDPVRLEQLDELERADRDAGSDAKRPASGEVAKKEEPKLAAIATRAPSAEVHPYCVLRHDDTWREIHVHGDVGGERVVVLTDGRVVVVSPPQRLDAPARLTLLDAGRATTVPVTFPPVANDVGRALRFGLWLDGFEERRPGVVGGWIESGGTMLGVEIALDGTATPGQLIHDVGAPFVSGRYGLGWTASRRGYETTDGGMSWTSIELPDPLIPSAKVARRACGPVGCLAHGWLRVGWGAPTPTPTPTPPPPHRAATPGLVVPRLHLSCDPLTPMPPAVAPRARSTPSAPSSRVRLGSLGNPPVLGTFSGLSELPSFFSQPAQALRDAERGVYVDVRELVDRYPNMGALARVYGWGPKTGEWETLGRWQVKWLSPFGGWTDVRASLPTPPPGMILDMTRAPSTYYGSFGAANNALQLAPGDDASHALLVGKRAGRSEGLMYELEADRAPVEVQRADGEPFGEIEGVVRAAGRWFVAAPPAADSAAPMTAIWQIEGAVARELVRIPRAKSDLSSSSARTRLARRSDGRAIALVVDGQPTAERPASVRWALPIDLESGALGEPEPLGYVDLAGRAPGACADDAVGWVLDTSLPSTHVRMRTPRGAGSLGGVLARLRWTTTRTCVEALAGTYDGQSQERAAELARSGGATAPSHASLRPTELLVSAMSVQTRFSLKCTVSPTK